MAYDDWKCDDSTGYRETCPHSVSVHRHCDDCYAQTSSNERYCGKCGYPLDQCKCEVK